MGIYGNMLANFPELKRRISVWTKDDKSDMRTIVGIFLPTAGDKLKRMQYSRGQGLGRAGGSAIDYTCDDELFVSSAYLSQINVGDYFRDPDDNVISRVVGKEHWEHAGSFVMFTTQRVTGPLPGEATELHVKEPVFG